jgi:CBS domain-containing protein
MLLRNMQVLEIMKTHVVKTTGEATLAEAADLLDLYQTTGLPVIDAEGFLHGMLTETDIVRAARALTGHRAAGALVKAWMTAPAVSVHESADVTEAAHILLTKGLKRLPVVTDAGAVVGVLNRIDLLQAVFEGALPDVFTDES